MGDTEAENTTTSALTPVTIEGDLIVNNGNKATLPGNLHQVGEFYLRTQQFQDLIEDGVCSVGSKVSMLTCTFEACTRSWRL